jgi:hypothetical protein
MKNNLLRTVSDWLLATSVILSVILFIQFYFRSHEMRAVNIELQMEAARYQNNHALMNLLLADVMEYSKRNPAINPILEQAGKPPAAPAPAVAPKPPGK